MEPQEEEGMGLYVAMETKGSCAAVAATLFVIDYVHTFFLTNRLVGQKRSEIGETLQ